MPDYRRAWYPGGTYFFLQIKVLTRWIGRVMLRRIRWLLKIDIRRNARWLLRPTALHAGCANAPRANSISQVNVLLVRPVAHARYFST